MSSDRSLSSCVALVLRSCRSSIRDVARFGIVLAVAGLLAPAPAAAQALDGADPPAEAAPGDVSEGEGETATEPTEATGPAEATEPTEAGADASLQTKLAALEQKVAELEAEREADEAADAAVEDPAVAEILASAETDAALAEVTDESRFDIYGFTDMGLQRVWGSLYDLGLGATDGLTFVFGNANLYFDFNPEPDWRFLIETRLTLMPFATEQLDLETGQINRFSAEYVDASSTNSGFSAEFLNGLIIERAHIDYTPRDDINVRTGYFLTPFGIWNVDHGTPVRVSLLPPLMIVSRIMPERQLGVQAFGRLPLGSWMFGYHAYVSNGAVENQVDVDDDKGVGGRLQLSRDFPTPMSFGVSGVYWDEENETKDVGIQPDGSLGLVRTTESHSYNTALGADARVDLGDLRLIWEAAVRWELWEEGLRRLSFGVPSSDRFLASTYGLAAYRLPWAGLEPYVMGEFLRIPNRILEAGALGSVGLNIHFSPAASLRFQYAYVRTFDLEPVDDGQESLYLHSAASRLVLAF